MSTNNNNQTSASKYKTFKSVEAVNHKVKYHNIKTSTEYEDIVADLLDKKYVSVYSEKHRTWKKKSTISIYVDKNIFENRVKTLFAEFMGSLLGENIENIDDVKKVYYFSKKLDTVVKINYNPQELYLETEWMKDDSIYRDSFTTFDNKGKLSIIIDKKIIAPTPIEVTSQFGALAKWYLKKEWKIFEKSIMEGIKYG